MGNKLNSKYWGKKGVHQKTTAKNNPLQNNYMYQMLYKDIY